MSKIIKKNYFLIVLCITISIFLLCFSVEKTSGRRFLEKINIENISSIEISFREKNVLSDDAELIKEFKNITQKLAAAKDASVRMKREIRNVYIFTFSRDENLYKIHISYPDSKEYVSIYIVNSKYSTNLCCELQEEDWLEFIQFLKKCNEIVG